MRKSQERCDQCGKFVHDCQLYCSGLDETKSICKKCNTENYKPDTYKELPGRREFYATLPLKRTAPKPQRQERKNVYKLIHDSGAHYALYGRQVFCETGKSWEIWDTEPRLRFVKRWSKKHILVVLEK